MTTPSTIAPEAPKTPSPSLAEVAESTAAWLGACGVASGIISGPEAANCYYVRSDDLRSAIAAEAERDRLRRRAAELVRAENACGWITNREIVAWAEMELAR